VSVEITVVHKRRFFEISFRGQRSRIDFFHHGPIWRTLILGASNQINNSSGFTLNGGTLSVGGFTEGDASTLELARSR